MIEDCQQLIESLDAKIDATKEQLFAATRAAESMPVLAAAVERLEAAKKALTAPQTPSGRKRIGQGAKRRKREPDADPPAPAKDGRPPICMTCKKPTVIGEIGVLIACVDADCEAELHVGSCYETHVARYHAEADHA